MAMKVMNWLHRKLHPKVDYCHISPKKDAFIGGATEETKELELMRESAAELDTEALLLHDILLNGILTIGTLGHRHSFLSDEEDFLTEKKEDKKMEECEARESTEKEELERPAIVVVEKESSAILSRVQSVNMKSSSIKRDMIVDVTTMVEMEMKKRDEELEDVVKIQEKPLLMEELEEKRENRGRTTLAELFAAETFADEGDLKEERGKRGNADGGTDFQLKLCKDHKMDQRKKGEKSPAAMTGKKLNRLIRKMLRKKIHPEHLNMRSSEKGPLIVSPQVDLQVSP